MEVATRSMAGPRADLGIACASKKQASKKLAKQHSVDDGKRTGSQFFFALIEV